MKFSERHDQETSLQAVPNIAKPFEPPPGTTHYEFLILAARDKFDEGDWNAGLSNLAHAAHVAITKREQVDEFLSVRLMREVVGAGWHPDDWPGAA